ncbi:hypothetical protein PF010_g27932 [Phytophthora fragariae]|uniref:Reverse transcriptase n=1 Tax=Phytophthora fragariae TaxID=53985 RepID=A0A6A3HX93_9STRA|nr:hypothetical protein PF011_g24795 [Phytophthora fragariae]KAE9066120.1 hypothetical protein PF010_g27932 [Phytophthora fragariae]
MVMGMPWLARHDPVIDWTKRTIVHFGSSCATVSDDPVGAAHVPRGACDPPAEAARRAAASGHRTRTPTTERVVGRKCESNQKTQIRSDSRGSRSVKSDAVVSTISVDTQDQQEEPVTNKDSDSDASAQGADVIGPNVERRSAVRRRGKEGAPALGADAAGSADGCKRPAPEMLACSRAAGLHDEAARDQARLDCVRPREEPAGDLKKDLSGAGPGQNKTRGTGFRTRSERRTAQASKAAQVSVRDRDATRSICRADSGTGDARRDPECLDEYEYWSPVYEDEVGEPSDVGVGVDFASSHELEALRPRPARTEGVGALSAKSKKERFDEQSWDSLKSSPFYEVLREYRDVLPDDIPAELPQDKGVQHEIDLVPGTKYCVTRQWPLPREQVKAIDDFFESRRKAGQVRESKSPHSAPTF